MLSKFFKIAAIILLVLTSCGEPASTAIPRLQKELQSKESGARNKAALALASYGKDAAPAIPSLIRLLSDDNGGVRTSAAYALRNIGTKEAILALDKYEK